MSRKLIVLTLVFILTGAFNVLAETQNTGNMTDTGTMGNNMGNQGYNTNNYRTAATDDGVDWGWLGLLGLAGLAGLRGRNRDREPQR